MPQESDIPQTKRPATERRAGKPDRRTTHTDRRNEDRIVNEEEPRRNPDVADRRKSR